MRGIGRPHGLGCLSDVSMSIMAPVLSLTWIFSMTPARCHVGGFTRHRTMTFNLILHSLIVWQRLTSCRRISEGDRVRNALRSVAYALSSLTNSMSFSCIAIYQIFNRFVRSLAIHVLCAYYAYKNHLTVAICLKEREPTSRGLHSSTCVACSPCESSHVVWFKQTSVTTASARTNWARIGYATASWPTASE